MGMINLFDTVQFSLCAALQNLLLPRISQNDHFDIHNSGPHSRYHQGTDDCLTSPRCVHLEYMGRVEHKVAKALPKLADPNS